MAVDLVEPHLINTIMFKADPTGYAVGTHDLNVACYVAETIPATPVRLDKPKDHGMVECETHKGWSTRVLTCTCRFLLGRYALLIMGAARYDLAELAVFGVPIRGATGQ